MSHKPKVSEEKIYIQLLDEGTPTWRPTSGVRMDELIYKVLATKNYDPADEKWEFTPGSIVRCERQEKGGEEIMVAVELCAY